MCDQAHVNYVERRKAQRTLFFTHGMKGCIRVFAEKQCPRNEYCAARIYRSECHLASPPGVAQPLNSDRRSARGQCPNTGRFAHLATGESFSQSQISDCQITPGHCPNAGHCVILTVRILNRPNGSRLNQFIDISNITFFVPLRGATQGTSIAS